jgi:hypothetical protein
MVEKGRVDGESRTIGYICGLGAMSHTEFKHFQKWAHGIRDQRMRKEMVMACPLTITESKRAKEKVAGLAQQKTTVKRAPKKKVIDKVKEEEKAKKKVEEREKFRREYEKKHGIPKSEKLKKDVSKKVYETYKIGDLTHAQELEAEIKTLKGDKADKSLIQQREKKIKSILGKKYKSCREVATAAKKGDVFIDIS